MSVLQEAEKLLGEMKPAEKAHLLQYIVRDLGGAFPGIESRPDVCGGEPCMVRMKTSKRKWRSCASLIGG
jgi:hypothetical protein